MTKYVEVINDNNIITIDDTTPRLYKTRSVPLNTLNPVDVMDLSNMWAEEHWSYASGNAEFRPRFIKRYDITFASNEVFFSIRSNANVPQAGFAVSQKDKLFYALNRTVAKSSGLESNFVLDFYGTLQNNNNAHGVGLQIFNENGNLIFDSSKYYLNVESGFFYNNENYKLRWNADLRNGFSTGASRTASAIVLNSSISAGYLFEDFDDIYGLIYFAIFDGTIKIRPWIIMLDTLLDWSSRLPNDCVQNSGLIVKIE